MNVTELAKALIACPSVTPAAGLVFDCLESQLKPLGFAQVPPPRIGQSIELPLKIIQFFRCEIMRMLSGHPFNLDL